VTRYWTSQMEQCVSCRGPSRTAGGWSLGVLLLEAGIGHAALGTLFLSALVT